MRLADLRTSTRLGELADRVRPLRFTVSFTAALVAAELGCAALDAEQLARLTRWASTSVERLSTEPAGPLLVSPFVVLDHRAAWPVLAALALGLTEARLGWRRTLLIAGTAHVLGTLVSEGIVGWRVHSGALPKAALHQVDVGASYVVVGALAAAAVVARTAPGRLVAAAVGAVLAPQLLAGLPEGDVAAVGHLTAGLVGGIAGWVCVVEPDERLRIRDPKPIRRR